MNIRIVILALAALPLLADQPKVTSPAPAVQPGFVSKFQIAERVDALQKQRAQMQQTITAIDGAIADYQYMLEEIRLAEERAKKGIKDGPYVTDPPAAALPDPAEKKAAEAAKSNTP